MTLSFDECRALLDLFKRSYPAFLMRSEVHSVQVVQLDDRPVLTVLITDDLKKESLLPDERIPDNLAYELQGKEVLVPIELKVGPIARAHVGVLCNPGDPASGDPANYFGTLGWNIYLNDVLVCMSNWHVFCAQGNATPYGWNISINGSVEAKLYAFQPLYPTGNMWDYALARYIQPSDATGVMRQCADGGTLPYPDRLSLPNSVRVGDGAQYYKVGARSPTCRTGTLIGVGDVSVKYDDNTVRSFQNQLIFSKMTDAGDSGAVIVRQSDISVTGLNFAGSDTQTIANPIYLAGWWRTGSIRFDGGAEIPMFIGNPAMSDPSARQIDVSAPPGEAFRKLEPAVLAPPPNLSAGLLFLGSATRVYDNVHGTVYYQGMQPPPAIRDKAVQIVTSSTKFPLLWGNEVELVMYFG